MLETLNLPPTPGQSCERFGAEVLRYPIPTKDVMRNKARAANAWFGEFVEKARP